MSTRILMDLRVLNQGDATGVGRYAANLAAQLLPLTSEDYRFTGASPVGLLAPHSARHIDVDLPEADGDEATRMLALLAHLERADVVFSPYYPVPERRSCRAVLTIHDLIPLRHPEWFANDRTTHFFDRVLRKSARAADHIVADSACTKADVVELYGIPEERISVAPLAASRSFGADPNSAPDREVLSGLGLDAPYVLSAATLEPRKNLLRILEAYSLVRNDGIDVRLVVAGKQGWGTTAVLEAVSRNPYASDIRIVGYVPDSTLGALYRQAELFLYPSLYEGFGLPVLEAMTARAPVVVSATGALREVAGDAAEYCTPTSVESIAAACERVLTDAERRQALIRQGRERASRFSWDETAARTRDALLGCAHSGRSGVSKGLAS